MANQISLLQDVNIIPSNGKMTYNITSQIGNVVIYESIFNFNISGYVSFLDTNNYLEKIPINNLGRINIKIGNNKSGVDLQFSICGITELEKLDGNKKQYNIQFVSSELISNYSTRISKGYAGSTNEIIKDILSRFSRKRLYTDKTTDNILLLAAYHKPYDLIDTLCTCAAKDFDWLYWENFRGLNFNRISKLLNNKPVHHVYEQNINAFSEKDIMKHGRPSLLTNNIISYSNHSKEDYISDLRAGVEGANVVVYDSLAGMPLGGKVNKNNSNAIRYVFNTNNLNYLNIASRRKILKQLYQNTQELVLNGDITRSTGDAINVNILGASMTPEYQSELSGNFIITSIEHDLNTSKYIQTIGVSK